MQTHLSQSQISTHQDSPLIKNLTKGIEWCFYALFFITPLVIWKDTFELFEFNKMWFVFAISLIILFLWISKIIITKTFTIRRTPLDIPILLFLSSQVISTIFSLDSHVSWWGYYSRFNGGLLSITAYIFLYYAFGSNLTWARDEGEKKSKNLISYKLLIASLFSGIIVALWGFPSHFGYDPTCFFFRGVPDVSCWTEAFQPKIRIFSTLGQPNWMAVYMSILLPLALAIGLRRPNNETPHTTKNYFKVFNILFFVTAALFYIDLLWTRSQSGFMGFWLGFIIFISLCFIMFFKKKLQVTKKYILYGIFGTTALFLGITFFVGSPIEKLNTLTLDGLKSSIAKDTKATRSLEAKKKAASTSVGELGGTDSGKIRLIVWQGAFEIFKRYPLFGSGVETFAYAYYKDRPQAHNLTSEWDYLYNKAHNEYLNYLATTGAFGLGSYLLIIVVFLLTVAKTVFSKQTHISNHPFLGMALLGSYIGILVSNFFGFSVVMTNMFFFIIPLLFYDLAAPQMIRTYPLLKNSEKDPSQITSAKTISLITVGIIIFFIELFLLNSWLADRKYAYGYNLNKVGEYTQANQFLVDAIKLRPGEDVYKDEASVNFATLALLSARQNQPAQASQAAKLSKALSDEVIANHPNNVIYYKSRTRVLYSLSQIDKKFLPEALEAIQSARILAPTDAKIGYNMALLLSQAGNQKKAVETLIETTKLKPDYRDAYYALALFYSEISKNLEKSEPAQSQEIKRKAVETLRYTLKNIEPNDKQAKDLLQGLK